MIASGHDGAGTVAFVAAGTTSALLGLVGRMPTRMTGKDYAVEFSEELERVVDELTIEQKMDVVTEAIAERESTQSERDLVAALNASIVFDHMAEQFLRRCLDSSQVTNWVLKEREGGFLGGDLTADAVVAVSEVHKVYVQFKQRTNIQVERRYLDVIASRNRHPAGVASGLAVLIVVNSDISANTPMPNPAPLPSTSLRRIVIASSVANAVETLCEMNDNLMSGAWTGWQPGETAPDI
ncbi:MAG: hypothetical protein WCG47_14750 [Dermatophilaceae bacterium]